MVAFVLASELWAAEVLQTPEILQANDQPPGSSAATEQSSTVKVAVTKLRLRRGDTLLQILAEQGITGDSAHKLVSAASKKVNLKKLRAGQTIYLCLSSPVQSTGMQRLIGLIISTRGPHHWLISRNYKDQFTTQKLRLEDALNHIKSGALPTGKSNNGNTVRNIILQRGDTLSGILLDLSVPARTTQLVTDSLAKEIDPRKLQAGQFIRLIFKEQPDQRIKLKLSSISIQLGKKKFLSAFRETGSLFTTRYSDVLRTTEKTQMVVIASEHSNINPETRLSDQKLNPDKNPQPISSMTSKTHSVNDALQEKPFELRKGDILLERLVGAGASRNDTHLAITSLRSLIDLRRLQVGQQIIPLFYNLNGGTQVLAGIVIPRSKEPAITIGRRTDGIFTTGWPEPYKEDTITLDTSSLAQDVPAKDDAAKVNAATIPITTPPSSTESKIQQTSLHRQMKTQTINKGDTLSDILQQMGVRKKDSKLATQSMRGVFNPNLIRAGQELVTELSTETGHPRLISLLIGVDKNTTVLVTKQNEQFIAQKTSSKALAEAIKLADKIEAAKLALNTGEYSHDLQTLYDFRTAESDLVELLNAERIQVRLSPGDTLFETMIEANISPNDANLAISTMREIIDPRKLKAGQNINFAFVENDTSEEHFNKTKLAELTIDLSLEQRLRVARLKDGTFAGGLVRRQLAGEYQKTVGTIESSLYKSASSAGLRTDILVKLIRLFSYDVDFQRDIRKGDQFEVLYESFSDENGKPVSAGVLLYASMTLSGSKVAFFRFTLEDGTTDYFEESGQSVKKALMRTPIDGARLTSHYGRRKHPTLGYSKMHRGVDFGAPQGTPIYAAGDGLVEWVGRNGAYGKYIRLRHGPKYRTAYAHLSRYANGIRRTARVKQGQVIGYVGSTGRSTGPHLHYEVLVDGKQVNPLNVKLPTGNSLHGPQLTAFIKEREKLTYLFGDLPVKQTIAKTQN